MPQKKNPNGLWSGALADDPTHSMLVADFSVAGNMMIGQWYEKRVGAGTGQRRKFTSMLSGVVHGSQVDLIEKRNDGAKFHVQFTLSTCGNRLVGQWRRLEDEAPWYTVDLKRTQGPETGSGDETKTERKVAALLQKKHTNVRKNDTPELVEV